MKKYNIVFHLGLHKTGTTFLQQEIFPKLSGVNYKVYFNENKYELNDEINLISCESLSGSPTTWINLNVLLRDLIAYGIKSQFPDAKIIVGFRNKEKWLKSIYTQAVKEGNTNSSYDRWYAKFDKRHIDFEGYLNLLESLFNNVYVYYLEDLQNDPITFVNNICEFIGVQVPPFENKIYNNAWKGWRLYVGRLRSYIFRVSRKFLDGNIRKL